MFGYKRIQCKACKVRTLLTGLFILLLCQLRVMGQVDESYWIEQWIENEESGADLNDLYEQTAGGRIKKIDLNKVEYGELSMLSFLSSAQILAILEHRKQYGKLHSVYELQSIKLIDKETIQRMLPHVKTTKSVRDYLTEGSEYNQNMAHEWVATWGRRLQTAQGYKSAHDSATPAFIGDPNHLIIRYRAQYKNRIFAGYTGEKDPGEAIFAHNNPHGLDFNSFHLYYKGMPGEWIQQMALGDFQAQFGQGLVMGSGIRFGKSPSITQVKRAEQGFRPYRSLNENDFFRGIAIQTRNRSLQTSVFAALNILDGNLQSIADSFSETDYNITSFMSSGLHRTEREISQKNTIQRSVLGSNVQHRGDRGSVGYTAIFSSFAYPVSPANRIDNQFAFSGKNILNQGLHYSYTLKNTLVFGEMAFNQQPQNLSHLHGIIIGLGKKLDWVTVMRSYSKDYHYIYANPFAESTRFAAESGVYTGFVWRPRYPWRVKMYWDQFRYNWPRYFIHAPSYGTDWLTEIEYEKRKHYLVYVRYRRRMRQQNADLNLSKLRQPLAGTREQMRIHITKNISPYMSIKSRIESVRVWKNEGVAKEEIGSLVFTDLSYQSQSGTHKFYLRALMFATEGFDSRLFAYENDMLYRFTVLSFFDKGSRFALLYRLKARKKTDLWIKLGHTEYSNRSSIGSGFNRIMGNQLTDIYIQIRQRW